MFLKIENFISCRMSSSPGRKAVDCGHPCQRYKEEGEKKVVGYTVQDFVLRVPLIAVLYRKYHELSGKKHFEGPIIFIFA